MSTRIFKDSYILIDNIYSNVPNIYESGESGVRYCIRSTDHMPIFTVRSLSKHIEGVQFRHIRNFSKKNI